MTARPYRRHAYERSAKYAASAHQRPVDGVPKDRMLSVRLTAEQYDALDALGVLRGRMTDDGRPLSRAGVVRWLLADEIDRRERMGRPLRPVSG